MKINAYVMASELPWVQESICSYYEIVNKIVVSFDKDNLSWTQRPLQVAAVIEAIKQIDKDGKVVVISDNFHSRLNPLENDTYQRKISLEHAGRGADWVLQFDTDEIVVNPGALLSKLELAASKDACELWYPSLWVYNQSKHFNIVYSDRFYRPVGSYPGPIAVRPNVRLECARQSDSRSRGYVVGLPRYCPIKSDYELDQDIKFSDWVLHMSWVRDQSFFDEKAKNSGHANDFDWMLAKKSWNFARDYPFIHCLRTPFSRYSSTLSRHTLVRRTL
jgi:hypothetical protein